MTINIGLKIQECSFYNEKELLLLKYLYEDKFFEMSESKLVKSYLKLEVSDLHIQELFHAVENVIRGISCTCVLMKFSGAIEDKHNEIELLEGESFECNVVKGFSYWRSGEDDIAIEYLDLAIHENEYSDVALSIRASLTSDSNPQRLDDSYKAYSLNPTVRNLFSLGCKFQGGKHDSLRLAKHFYKKVVKIKSDFTCAHRHYANYLKDEKKYKKAIKIYKIVISQKTSNQAYYNLWYCYSELKSEKKSLLYAEIGKVYRPNDNKLNFALGYSYSKNKKFTKSIQFYKLYLKSNPDSKVAKNNLEIVINSHNNYLIRKANKLLKTQKLVEFINHTFKVKALGYSLEKYKKLYSEKYLRIYKPVSVITENNELVKFFVEASNYIGTDEKKTKLRKYSKDMSLFGLGSIVHFGKHKGNTISQIIEIESDYVLWCLINMAFFYVDYEVLINEHLRGHTYYLKALEYNLAKHYIQDNSLIDGNNSDDYSDYSSYDSRPSYEESLRDALDGQMDAYWNID